MTLDCSLLFSLVIIAWRLRVKDICTQSSGCFIPSYLAWCLILEIIQVLVLPNSECYSFLIMNVYFNISVYVILGKYFEFVGLMDHLYDRGLLDTGEYFVVGVHLGYYNSKDPQIYFKGICQYIIPLQWFLNHRLLLVVMF